MSMDPAEKMIDLASKPDGKHAKLEKYVLRKAFDTPENPYLPEEVLWRQKEQFSDGVGYSWVDGLQAYANKVRFVNAELCSYCLDGTLYYNKGLSCLRQEYDFSVSGLTLNPVP